MGNYIKNNHACCIGEWDVSRVTDMSELFFYDDHNEDVQNQYTLFNQDLGSWNVERVKDMSNMFDGATSFDQKLCWDLSHIEDDMKDDMFSGTVCEDVCVSCWHH